MTKLISYSYKLLTVAVLSLVALSATALPASHFATSSRLASGHWVKIKVADTGVYQITDDELKAMGFSNPQNVAIFGSGGYAQPDALTESIADDLVAVPVTRYANKICFWAQGPIKFSMSSSFATSNYFTRDINGYSSYGYYFITESAPTAISEAKTTAQGTNVRSNSLDYFYHEREMVSLSSSGRQLLGEDITNGATTFSYSMPSLCTDSAIMVSTSVAVKDTSFSYIQTSINGENVTFSAITNRITPARSTYLFFNTATPTISFKPTQASENGNVSIGVTPSTPESARLDYFIATYWKKNVIVSNSQTQMAFTNLAETDVVALPNATSSTQVWCIDNEENPVRYQTSTTDTALTFTPGYNSTCSRFVAFDPAGELLKIDGYEEVANQDLHASEVPNLLIVTNSKLIGQAERIAQLHRNHDAMKVLVVDQQQVFNEFSSGTPSPMAIRMFAKMLYDRDASTFKSILLFGSGTYDNRGLLANRDYCVITFESENSNDEDYSYTCDDFFGMMTDGTGAAMQSEVPTIAVGRITSASLEEATTDVDKLIKYVRDLDYGNWRNNIMVIADEGDYGLHVFQAENIRKLIENTLNPGFNMNKCYVEQYKKANEPGVESTRQVAEQAKRKWGQLLQQGQYFVTYIGHAGPSTFTKTAKAWTLSDVQSTSYEHMPIMTTATCDVARYDSDVRGIAEHMLHKTDGGAIALVTSTRAVYAESNDVLNQAFMNCMFNPEAPAGLTLGDCYLASKTAFGSTRDFSKLSFMLLGDPAIKIAVPENRIKFNTINDQQMSPWIHVTPLSELKVDASILKSDSTIDETFNGTATLTLLDAEQYNTVVTQRSNGTNSTISVYYPRPQLAQVTAPVTNGRIDVSTIIPRHVRSNGDHTVVLLYASNPTNGAMAHGIFSQLNLDPATSITTTDTVAPEISEMYIGDAVAWQSSHDIASTSTLHIVATDNLAINSQENAVGATMTLTLDGGKSSLAQVFRYAQTSDSGKTLTLDMPLSGLTTGEHTLQFAVSDVAYNRTTRSISFNVGTDDGASEITTEQSTVSTEATFNFATSFAGTPQVTLHIADATGNEVFSTQIESFPFVWNLCDQSGNRVPAGLYRYSATVTATDNYAGTPTKQLIVVEPRK